MELAARWPDIVGGKLATLCTPTKISGRGARGVLHLTVKGAGAVLVEAESARILERLNLYCGAPVAHKVVITRAPARSPGTSIGGAAAGLSPSQTLALDEGLEPVEHPRLKAALKRLGRGAFRGGK